MTVIPLNKCVLAPYLACLDGPDKNHSAVIQGFGAEEPMIVFRDHIPPSQPGTRGHIAISPRFIGQYRLGRHQSKGSRGDLIWRPASIQTHGKWGAPWQMRIVRQKAPQSHPPQKAKWTLEPTSESPLGGEGPLKTTKLSDQDAAWTKCFCSGAS